MAELIRTGTTTVMEMGGIGDYTADAVVGLGLARTALCLPGSGGSSRCCRAVPRSFVPMPQWPDVMKQIDPPADAEAFEVLLEMDPGLSVPIPTAPAPVTVKRSGISLTLPEDFRATPIKAQARLVEAQFQEISVVPSSPRLVELAPR
jgi:hypothetical protein